MAFGYAISYYYFGYVMTAMLAQLTGLTGSVAHNLMTSLVFGLAAIGSFGILYDLLAARNAAETAAARPDDAEHNAPLSAPAFLAPLFLLLVSNLEGFLEVLHRMGLFWSGTHELLDLAGHQGAERGPIAAARLDTGSLLVVVARFAVSSRTTTWPATSARSSTSFRSSPFCTPTCIRMCWPSRSICWPLPLP